MSQCDAIMARFRQGHRLTAARAAKELGCWRLAARVKDLRDMGHNIVTTMIEGRDGVRYAQYHLSAIKPKKETPLAS